MHRQAGRLIYAQAGGQGEFVGKPVAGRTKVFVSLAS